MSRGSSAAAGPAVGIKRVQPPVLAVRTWDGGVHDRARLGDVWIELDWIMNTMTTFEVVKTERNCACAWSLFAVLLAGGCRCCPSLRRVRRRARGQADYGSLAPRGVVRVSHASPLRGYSAAA